MAVEDDQGIAGIGVRVEALGQQDVGAQVHRPAPELRQPLALDRLVLDVLRRGGRRDRRDDLVQRDRQGAPRSPGSISTSRGVL